MKHVVILALSMLCLGVYLGIAVVYGHDDLMLLPWALRLLFIVHGAVLVALVQNSVLEIQKALGK